jgi:hypothetical protein
MLRLLSKSICFCRVVLSMHIIIFSYQYDLPLIFHSLPRRDEATLRLAMQISYHVLVRRHCYWLQRQREIYFVLKFHISRLLVYSYSLHIQVITHATDIHKNST